MCLNKKIIRAVGLLRDVTVPDLKYIRAMHVPDLFLKTFKGNCGAPGAGIIFHLYMCHIIDFIGAHCFWGCAFIYGVRARIINSGTVEMDPAGIIAPARIINPLPELFFYKIYADNACASIKIILANNSGTLVVLGWGLPDLFLKTFKNNCGTLENPLLKKIRAKKIN